MQTWDCVLVEVRRQSKWRLPWGCGVQETALQTGRAPLSFRLHPSLERLLAHSLLPLRQS